MRFSLLAMSFLACAAPLWAQTAPRRVPKSPSRVAGLARPALQNEVAQVAARAKPSVVTVACEKPRSEATDDDDEASKTDPQEPVVAFGSGFVCRADGLILTNYHLVRGASLIYVLFGSEVEEAEQIPARVVGFDADSDLAVLKINRGGLKPLPLGSSGAASVGGLTIAIGAPLGHAQSVTLGVLSGRGQGLSDAPSTGPFLITDASLSPGSSGGPLLDLNGRVIGLNTEHVPRDESTPGLGFAVPADLIRRVLPQLEAGRAVKRAFLGAAIRTLSPAAAREFGLSGGVLLGALAPQKGSVPNPARQAGLREGDIVLGIDGKPVTKSEQLSALLDARAPGQKVRLSVARPDFAGRGNLKRLTVALVLADKARAQPAAPGVVSPAKPFVGSGLRVGDAKNLDAALKERYSLDGSESGAVVLGIAALSPADEAGLETGDRIVRARVGGKWSDIASAAGWKALIDGASPGARLLLDVRDSDDASDYRVLVLPAK